MHEPRSGGCQDCGSHAEVGASPKMQSALSDSIATCPCDPTQSTQDPEGRVVGPPTAMRTRDKRTLVPRRFTREDVTRRLRADQGAFERASARPPLGWHRTGESCNLIFMLRVLRTAFLVFVLCQGVIMRGIVVPVEK